MAQRVRFDIQPIPGPGVSVPTSLVPTFTTATVLPGRIVPYEIGVFIPTDPTFPFVQGLSSFDIDILTGLPVTQPPLTAFSTVIAVTFPVNQSLGTSSNSNILGISGQQNLTGIITPGFALNRRQILGQGQLFTPTFEGEFPITVTGTAQVLSTQTNITQVAINATTESSIGFTIITQAAFTPAGPITTAPATELPDLCAPLLGSLMCSFAGLYIMKLVRRK